jgi:hypothetical protein
VDALSFLSLKRVLPNVLTNIKMLVATELLSVGLEPITLPKEADLWRSVGDFKFLILFSEHAIEDTNKAADSLAGEMISYGLDLFNRGVLSCEELNFGNSSGISFQMSTSSTFPLRNVAFDIFGNYSKIELAQLFAKSLSSSSTLLDKMFGLLYTAFVQVKVKNQGSRS